MNESAGRETLAKPKLVVTVSIILSLLLVVAIVAIWQWRTTNWSVAYAADVAAIRDAVRANHPGAINDTDASFARWLQAGGTEAAARKCVIKDRVGYLYSLTAYTTGFGDTHLSVEPNFALGPAQWPGLIVGVRNGKAVVLDRDANAATVPPLGAAIEACDGKSIAALVATHVLPFGFDQRAPANRARAVAELFVDRGNSLSLTPQTCVVTVEGESKTLKLSYSVVPKDFAQRFDAALFGSPTKLEWSDPAPGVAWIGIPSFDYDEANATRLRKVIDRLSADASRIKLGRAIVFDVRGNTGGSSLWGDEIRNILWYPEQIAKHAPPDPSGVDWRASVGNRDYMLDLISQVIPKVGSQSGAGLALTRIARGLTEAVDQKKSYWREGSANPPPEGGLTKRRPKGEPALFPAKVIILSNGSCASACLDFADRILQMPGTYIVGFATSGDGQYTESRAIPLPSGHATLHLPMKVYRGRPRGNMEVYEPDLSYDGPWIDAPVRRWVLDLIERGELDPKKPTD